MYQNAKEHINGHLIASFDLKDFFPSTQIRDILQGLRYCESKGVKMIDAALLRGKLDALNMPRTDWSHDANVLIARLATYRGRLPQGSPFSPLLANIAFTPYDQKIKERLTGYYGSGYCYTRYFDDITISITRQTCNECRINDPATFKRECEGHIESALKNSNYKLQARKSRASRAAVGHKTTGLLVRSHEVRLTRQLTRHLRSTMKHLDTPFIEAADRWHEYQSAAMPQFQTIRKGHRWDSTDLSKHRISAERLSTLMLRKICPDLMAQRKLENWYPWQEHYPNETTLEGKRVWPIVEYILASLWAGQLQVTANDKQLKEITFAQGDQDICEFVSSGPRLDFFFLPFENAIAATEYWHYLRGMAGFLNAVPSQSCFAPIHRQRDQFCPKINDIEIIAEPSTLTIFPEKEVQPDTIDQHIIEDAKNIIAHQKQFRKWIGRDSAPGTDELAQTFYEPVTDDNSFDQWLETANELMIKQLPQHMDIMASEGSFMISSSELFEYLRMKTWSENGFISDNYLILDKFRNNIFVDGKKEPLPPASIQIRVLKLLYYFFESDASEKDTDANGWKDRLVANPFHKDLQEILTDSYTGLDKLYHALRSKQDETRFFSRASEIHIGCRDASLVTDKENNTSEGYWDKLMSFGHFIDSATRKSIDLDSWPAKLPKRPADAHPESTKDKKRDHIWRVLTDNQCKASTNEENRNILGLLKQLRNRYAHPEHVPENRKDWVELQTTTAKLLGRNWQSKTGKKHPQYIADDDLQLTGHEHALIKFKIMTSLSDLFQWLSTDDCWRSEVEKAVKSFKWPAVKSKASTQKHENSLIAWEKWLKGNKD